MKLLFTIAILFSSLFLHAQNSDSLERAMPSKTPVEQQTFHECFGEGVQIVK